MRSLATPATTRADIGSEDALGSSTRERRIETRMRIPLPPEVVFEGLLFYEEIARRPPLLLRLFLPTPICTRGRKSEVGDEARCIYDSGYLVKRVTRIDPPHVYEFRIVEQALEVGDGIALAGGRYTLRASERGGTEVTLETRYASPRRARWPWTTIESAIGHAFHRYILREMQWELRGARTPCAGISAAIAPTHAPLLAVNLRTPTP
jgi:hypothetical protein